MGVVGMTDRPDCPPLVCLRADGITCPDGECDYASGIYNGPVERWWLLGAAKLPNNPLQLTPGATWGRLLGPQWAGKPIHSLRMATIEANRKGSP